MRYPDGGGLSPAARGRRETVRLQAARLFAEDVPPVQVAARLRVSTKSAYQWRRRWRAGGEQALASTGPGGASCRLSDLHGHRSAPAQVRATWWLIWRRDGSDSTSDRSLSAPASAQVNRLSEDFARALAGELCRSARSSAAFRCWIFRIASLLGLVSTFVPLLVW